MTRDCPAANTGVRKRSEYRKGSSSPIFCRKRTDLDSRCSLWGGGGAFLLGGPNASLIQIAIISVHWLGLFERWLSPGDMNREGGGYVNNPVRAVVDYLQRDLGSGLISFKPPGAGAACSCILLTSDESSQSRARTLLAQQGWRSMPVWLNDGLQLLQTPGGANVTAPARADLVGAGDLSAQFGLDGCCLSLPIRPCSRAAVRFVGSAPKASAAASLCPRGP